MSEDKVTVSTTWLNKQLVDMAHKDAIQEDGERESGS